MNHSPYEQNLNDCLKDIEGITYSTTPTFVINWETMKVYNSSYVNPNDPNDLGKTPELNKSVKFDDFFGSF